MERMWRSLNVKPSSSRDSCIWACSAVSPFSTKPLEASERSAYELLWYNMSLVEPRRRDPRRLTQAEKAFEDTLFTGVKKNACSCMTYQCDVYLWLALLGKTGDQNHVTGTCMISTANPAGSCLPSKRVFSDD